MLWIKPRTGALAATLALLTAGPTIKPVEAQTPAPVQAPAPPRRPAAAAGQAAPAAAPPGRPTPAAAPVALPEPPIPVQHVIQAGIGQCVAAMNQVSRAALMTEYNVQSLWNQANPTQHVFQSVAGIHNGKNTPPSGMVAIVAAPIVAEKCDVVAVEVYPLAGSCADVQKAMAKGGEVETTLQDIKVLTDVQKRRLFLMPGFGNTCVAVSVNSFFGN